MRHLSFTNHIGREHSHLHKVGSMCHLNQWPRMLSEELRLTELTQKWLRYERLTQHLCKSNPEGIFNSTRVRKVDPVLIEGFCVVTFYIEPIDHTRLQELFIEF